MNWYKKAKLNYFDIGHKSSCYLWIFFRGILKADDRCHLDHYEIWKNIYEESFRDNVSFFAGRFDSISKNLSVRSLWKSARIPNVLLSKLRDEFGDDVKIHEF